MSTQRLMATTEQESDVNHNPPSTNGAPSTDTDIKYPSKCSQIAEFKMVFLLAFCWCLGQSIVYAHFSTTINVANELATESASLVPLGSIIIVSALMSMPASVFMRRFGRRNGFVISALVGAVGAAINIAALYMGPEYGGYSVLVLGCVIQGITVSFIYRYRFAAVEVSPEGKKETSISIVIGAGVVGAVLGPEYAKHARVLFDQEFVGTYILIVLVFILLAICIATIKFPSEKSLTNKNVTHPRQMFTDIRKARPLRHIVFQPEFFVIMVSSGFAYMTMAGLVAPIPSVVQKPPLNYTFEQSSTIIQIHAVGMFGPSFFTPLLIKTIGDFNTIQLGWILEGAGVAILLFGGVEFSIYASGLFLTGLGWNWTFVGCTTLLTHYYRPRETHKAQGINDLVFLTGAAVGIMIAAFIVDTFSWETLLWSCFIITCINIVAVFILIIYVKINKNVFQKIESENSPTTPNGSINGDTKNVEGGNMRNVAENEDRVEGNGGV